MIDAGKLTPVTTNYSISVEETHEEDYKNNLFSESSSKFRRKVKKDIIKNIKSEIKRLDKEYKENKALLNSYNKLIVDSLYYMIDRDNLTTSVLTGVHDSRIDQINECLSELKIYSSNKVFASSISQLSEKLIATNTNRQSTLRVINQDVRKCSNTMISSLNIYTKQLNARIEMILEQKKTLQRLFNSIVKLVK